MQKQDYIVSVSVNAPIDNSLSYVCDIENLPVGSAVEVPLGKRKVNGIVLGKEAFKEAEYELKKVQCISETRPQLNQKFISWCQWLSKYYFYPLGVVLDLAYPPLKKHGRKTKHVVVPEITQSHAPSYTDEQKKVIDDISKINSFNVHLLHGVTGSGKTEVYLKLIENCLNQDKTAIVLVPEISLTPQLLNRFAARYPDDVAIIHSQLTAREKTNQWWSAYDKKKRILIGARSALFCPVKDIGLIIIDEEHESSYKQDEKLKYNGRDAAIMLAKIHDCPIVLGSATPSLETYKNAVSGKFQYHEMSQRVHQQNMPEMKVIDLKKERENRGNVDLPFWLSESLHSAIDMSLKNSKQTALFLNRRGLAQSVVCPDCSFVYMCPNCEISLTLHNKSDLVCHYCEYTEQYTDNCPSCDSLEIKPLGLGTEKIEKDISELFPDARVERVDRDKVINRHQLEDIINRMESNEIDILIGTQMIAKGLDFKNLQTVGLVLADVGFNLPNFRSSERSFQLITQVSGRAGRNADDPGKVIIQAYNTEHPSIVHALKNDFKGFCESELNVREKLNYPPYGKLAVVKFSSNHPNKLQSSQTKLQHFNQKYIEKHPENLRILGPGQAPFYRLKNRFRHQMIVTSRQYSHLQHYCQYLLANKKNIFDSQVKVLVDIDPLNMM